MHTFDLVLRSRRVVTPSGIAPASIHVRRGIIETVSVFDDFPAAIENIDAGDAAVLPGLVDTHVHINEPGRTDWEGFQTATRAAAAGGITTLVEMPLNSIPATTSADAFREKCAAAEGKLWVNVGFWGGVVPGNDAELMPLFEAGVFGFKCFLVPSGVEEFPCLTESDLRRALPILRELRAPLLVHAELPGPIEAAVAECRGKNPRFYATWLASRPRAAEDDAIALLVCLAEEFKTQIHIVHLSSSDALPILRQAREKGLRISVETCPHYLTFSAEEIADGATQLKCAPPIREAENRELLWAALGQGLIDLVASDHSPCPPAMKCADTGDFLRAWGGIASLQVSLAAAWTQAEKRGYSLAQLAAWMAERPARIAGLLEKGAIAPGKDADFVIWMPQEMFRVDAAELHHRHKLTPYDGLHLRGAVQATYLRGVRIYDAEFGFAGPRGRILKRSGS